MHFADATGDALVISPDSTGELIFSRKQKGDGYLVSTNFNLANHSNGFFPSWRYDVAQAHLTKLMNQNGEFKIGNAVDILIALHVEAGTSWTIESMVADLPNKRILLYYFWQFDHPVVLNIADEIASTRSEVPYSDLFPDEVKDGANRRFQYILSNKYRFLILVWFGMVITSLIISFIYSISKQKGKIFWLPIVFLFGPLGLVILVVISRLQKRTVTYVE